MKKFLTATVAATALLALSACGGEADVAEGDDMAAEGEAMEAGDAMAGDDAMAEGDAMDGEGAAADGDAMESDEAMAEGEEAAMAEGDAAEGNEGGNGISIGRDGVTVEAEGHSANVNMDGDVSVD